MNAYNKKSKYNDNDLKFAPLNTIRPWNKKPYKGNYPYSPPYIGGYPYETPYNPGYPYGAPLTGFAPVPLNPLNPFSPISPLNPFSPFRPAANQIPGNNIPIAKYPDKIPNIIDNNYLSSPNTNFSNNASNNTTGINNNMGLNNDMGFNNNIGLNNDMGFNNNIGLNNDMGFNNNMGFNNDMDFNNNMGFNNNNTLNNNTGLNSNNTGLNSNNTPNNTSFNNNNAFNNNTGFNNNSAFNNNNVNLEDEYPSEDSGDELYSYNSNTTMGPANPNNLITPTEVLRNIDFSLDDMDSRKSYSNKDIDAIFNSIQEKNPSIFSALKAYRVPYPIATLLIKKVIQSSLDYKATGGK